MWQAYNAKLALTTETENMSSEQQASANSSPTHHPEQLITSDNPEDDIIKNVSETVTANDAVTETLVNESDKPSSNARQGTLFDFELLLQKQLLYNYQINISCISCINITLQ